MNNYRAFSGYQRGYSHVKNNTDCEDYARSYRDPDGRFYICTACDGHSDRNCFRSNKGAEFGCEAAIIILRRFFELYYEQDEQTAAGREILPAAQERLKRSMKQYWDQKIYKDIESNPITEAELEPLSEHVKNLYNSGQGQLNIYGATLLAAAVSKDFFIALHIGDGIIICADADGTYYEPLPVDEKSETGSPASLCDLDLFSRKDAFRSIFSNKIPHTVVVSSDGIGDCMDKYAFREFLYSLIGKFEAFEQKGQTELNASQNEYLKRCLGYWAEKGNGVEDDCSLAGIYNSGLTVPKVKIPVKEAEELWKNTVQERNEIIQDYEERKKNKINDIDQQVKFCLQSVKKEQIQERIEELGKTLRRIINNETEKIKYYDSKLKVCEDYIRQSGADDRVMKEWRPFYPEIKDAKPIVKEIIEMNAAFMKEESDKKKEQEKQAEKDFVDMIKKCSQILNSNKEATGVLDVLADKGIMYKNAKKNSIKAQELLTVKKILLKDIGNQLLSIPDHIGDDFKFGIIDVTINDALNNRSKSDSDLNNRA